MDFDDFSNFVSESVFFTITSGARMDSIFCLRAVYSVFKKLSVPIFMKTLADDDLREQIRLQNPQIPQMTTYCKRILII